MLLSNNKYNKLAKNSFFFAIGNFGSKLISFFLLPLYTYQLTTSEYGVADLIVTTVSLLLPVVSLSIYYAVLRFSLDKKNDNELVFTNALIITIISSILLLLSIPFLSLFRIAYGSFISIILIAQIYQALFSFYAKSIGNVKLFAINGIILTFLTAIFNIVFLVIFNLGIHGYLLSILLANLFSNYWLWFKLELSRTINFSLYNKEYIVSLLKYSMPLIPNSIAWWINSMIDRYFVLFFLDVTSNGLFAVASRIPAMIGVLNSIFGQAWQLSAIQEYESEDSSEFYSEIFSLYSRMMFFGTSGILFILRPLMTLLVAPEFHIAWKYVPFLLLTAVYSSFSGYLGHNYAAAKKTSSVLTTTFIGAGINIVSNAVLIPSFGLSGAGIASALGFFTIWIIRVFDTKKYAETKLDKNNIIGNHVIIFIQIYFLYVFEGTILASFQLLLLILSFVFNIKLFIAGYNMMKAKKK